MRQAIAILGPTAVGKSRLALRLASELNGEIVSADSLQAYRGFDVGTAKPSSTDRRLIPHHLIDILEPLESFSAGDFARRASAAVEEIHGRRRLAFVVGGSGLYLRALLDGISMIPRTSPEVRTELRDRLRREGLEALWRQLDELDPETTARLRKGDTQRILRALEVALSSGRPLSAWLAEDPTGPGPLAAVRIGLTLPRSVLYDRIAERVRTMVQAGWVEEVRDLLGRGFSAELPPFQAIGYRQLAAYVEGKTSLEEAVAATVQATRRYAKRQMTWFRKERAVTWFSMEDPQECHQRVTNCLTGWGIGGGNDQT